MVTSLFCVISNGKRRLPNRRIATTFSINLEPGADLGVVQWCIAPPIFTPVFTLPLSCDHRLAMYNNKYVLTSRPSFYLVVPRYFRVDFKFALFCHRISHFLRCFTNRPQKYIQNENRYKRYHWTIYNKANVLIGYILNDQNFFNFL